MKEKKEEVTKKKKRRRKKLWVENGGEKPSTPLVYDGSEEKESSQPPMEARETGTEGYFEMQ